MSCCQPRPALAPAPANLPMTAPPLQRPIRGNSKHAPPPVVLLPPGKAPPIPIPMKKRTTLSISNEPTRAVNNDASPYTATLPSKSGRRPRRSPIEPADRPPTRMPRLDQTKACVKAGPHRFQACVTMCSAPASGHSHQAGVASSPDLPSAMAWRPDHVGRRDARGRVRES